MGRTMPTYCEHDRIISWGSFGAEDGSSKREPCAECDARRARLRWKVGMKLHAFANWLKNS